MTHARPMFPPRADRATRSERSGAAITCNSSVQVIAPAVLDAVSTPAAKAGVANSTCSQTEQVDRHRNCALSEPFSGPSALAAPEGAPDGPFVRTEISPEDLLKALGRLRREAAAEIERLIDLLDEIGPDPDLEPAGDELEPSLGALESHPVPDTWRTRKGIFRDNGGAQLRWADAVGDDREQSEDVSRRRGR